MPIYHLHVPHPTRRQALSIPLYTRSGKRVANVTAINTARHRVTCIVEGSTIEHTYDRSDLVHHYGEAGVREYLRDV